MGVFIDRSREVREKRSPDIFLSHSSRDKGFTRFLAEDLCYCEVDAWLDEWEIQAGESLYEVISHAMERSRLVAVVLGDNYSDSKYAKDELKQALAQERRLERTVVVPLLCGNTSVPPFLEDKLYIDFRYEYWHALVRLSSMKHNIPKKDVEEAIRIYNPRSIHECIKSLRYCGIEPYVIVDKDYIEEIKKAGGIPYLDGRLRFDPAAVRDSALVSPRVRRLMEHLIKDVWR